MKTKVLVVPTLIILSGYMAISFIKPSFDEYREKRVVRDDVQQRAMLAESVAKNVVALKSEMETQKEKVTAVKRYLPAEKDEARIFDSMNFLASQSGLVTSLIQLQSVEDQIGEDGNISQTFATSADPETSPDDQMLGDSAVKILPEIQPYTAPLVKKYSLAFEALGGYTNIKELVKKLEGFDRFQRLESFEISTGESAATGDESVASTGTLTFRYNALLPYQELPGVISGEAIVNIPGFQEGSFNLSAIDAMQTKITSVVPDAVLGTDGKPNPFE